MKHKLLFRRFFTLLLFSAVSSLSWAYDFDVDGIYYDKNWDGISVTVTYENDNNPCYSGSVEIPSTVSYGGITYSVTNIGEWTFSGCSDITSVTIPNSVTSIGEWAFSFCTALTSVTIPNSVTTISRMAFDGCTGLTSITIPNSLTSIGEGAFYGCLGLVSFTIPNSLMSIENDTFRDCTGLTSITIPNSVANIGNNAFAGCSGLKSVTIGNGVTSIGASAFFGCSSITSITIPNNVATIGNSAFSRCSGLTSITIPGNVKEIDNFAFSKCTNMANITLMEGVTKIGTKTFEGCEKLEYISIPQTVTSIGDYFLSGSPGKVYINCNVPGCEITNGGIFAESFVVGAFSGCDATEIVIGKDVKKIGETPFSYGARLTSLTVEVGNTVFDSRNNCNAIIKTSENQLVVGCDVTTIPNGVTSIGDGAFCNCQFVTLNIPASVVSIEKNAFRGSGIVMITLPPNIRSVGARAFGNCSKLQNVTIPDEITEMVHVKDNYPYVDGQMTIESGIFESCTSLPVEGGLRYAGSYLVEAVNQNALSYSIKDGTKFIGPEAFQGCNSMKSLNIPDDVTSICYKAFAGCSGLTSITIPNSVKSIGSRAFYGCSGLTSVTIPEGVTNIGELTFYNCSALTSVMLPNGMTSIGDYAFSDCSGLMSVTIPESVSSIGNRAFYNCSSLKTVTCEAKNVPTIGTSVFENVPQSSVILYVSASALDDYKTADLWKDFGMIKSVNNNPIYIEKDLTSNFPIDWQGWIGATGDVGLAAPRVTTNDGRITPACERFDGSQATTGTIFTRTLTGLTNGTYRIELYGAAASTKGRDTNIDSDMTADNEGDETAVYLYATTPSGTIAQHIPVHWATDFNGTGIATATLNEVEVTDGTIEIGMYSEKKYTNWHVVQIKGVTALVDAEEMHTYVLQQAQNTLVDETYAAVTGGERTALSQAIADNTTVSERSAEAYLAAIDALEDATNMFTIAKAGYEALVAAKVLVEGRSYPYADEAKKSATEVAATAANTTPLSFIDAGFKKDDLLMAYRQYAESSALMEGVEGAEDVTATYIQNPKAEDAIDATVWQTVRSAGSGGKITILSNQPWTDGSGSTSHCYFDGGNWSASAWDLTFKQDVALPAGRYQLTALGRSAQEVTLTLFAGDESAEMARTNDVGGLFNRGWEQTSVEFELATPSTISIGVRGVTNVLHTWMSFSDFRLVRFPDAPSAINSLQAEDDNAAADALIYDLGGRRLTEKPKRGFYIQGGKKYLAQ